MKEVKNEQPNRYHLIAKPKNCKNINDLLSTDHQYLNLSKVIFIEIPSIDGELNQIAPKKFSRVTKGKQKIENATKTKLALIDLYVLDHSREAGEQEFRDYLNHSCGYEIPEDYDFSIVYRMKNREYVFRYLEPIYGNITSISNFLEPFAMTEYESRFYPQEMAQRRMMENPIWQNYYHKMIKEDIHTKATLVSLFNEWEDKRGSVNKKRKKDAKDEFLKMLRHQGEVNINFLPQLTNQPLSVVMYACQLYPNNEYASNVLKTKFSRYKDLRGYLLFRYKYFENKKMNEIRQELKKMKTGSFAKDLIVPGIAELCGTMNPSFYELLRYTDYTLDDFKKIPLLEIALNQLLRDQSDWNYAYEIQREIKKVKEKDEPDVIVPTTIHYLDSFGISREKRVYIEHEDERLLPEDFISEEIEPEIDAPMVKRKIR